MKNQKHEIKTTLIKITNIYVGVIIIQICCKLLKFVCVFCSFYLYKFYRIFIHLKKYKYCKSTLFVILFKISKKLLETFIIDYFCKNKLNKKLMW